MDNGDYLIQSSFTNILIFLGGTIVKNLTLSCKLLGGIKLALCVSHIHLSYTDAGITTGLLWTQVNSFLKILL